MVTFPTLSATDRREVREVAALASGGVAGRGMYFLPWSLASRRAFDSSFSDASRSEALAAYEARSQVLRNDVSLAVAAGFVSGAMVGGGGKGFSWGFGRDANEGRELL